MCGLLDSAYADGQLDAEEHRSRTASATAAKSLGELRQLVDDLQLEKPLPDLRERAPKRPSPPRRRRPVLAAVAVLVLLGAGFGIGRLTAPSPSLEDTPAAAPIVLGPTALHTPAGLRRLIDAVRAGLGSTLVADLTVYPGYASVAVPVPGAPGRAQSYSYRGGLDGPSNAGNRDPDDPLVDLATIDVDTVLGLLAGSGQSLNVENPTVHYMIVRDNGTGPEIAIYATNNDTGRSGYIEAKPDGTVIAVHAYERG